MKRVLVDMERLRNLNSGLGQVCLRLGHAFCEAPPADLSLTAFVPPGAEHLFGGGLEIQVRSPLHRILRVGGNYDVWHSLHQDAPYLPARPGTRVVLTVHDLNFLHKYTGARRGLRLRALQRRVRRADALTAISRYTADELCRHVDVAGRTVHVIHNGNSLEPSETPCSLDLARFGEYFLHLGIVSEKKNLGVLLPLLLRLAGKHLVVAGPSDNPSGRALLEEAHRLGLGDRFHLLGPVSEDDKFHLYRNCRALLFPSLQEGFGLPVVEAMSVGKPVFAARRTSLPEVGGSEAFYFDTFAPDAMATVVASGLQEYDADPGRATRLVERSRLFSWQAASRAYLDLYRSL